MGVKFFDWRATSNSYLIVHATVPSRGGFIFSLSLSRHFLSKSCHRGLVGGTGQSGFYGAALHKTSVTKSERKKCIFGTDLILLDRAGRARSRYRTRSSE